LAAARRFYLYGIALIGLVMLIIGLAALVQLLFETIARGLLGIATAAREGDLVERLSWSGATAGIGLVAWLVHWGLANRRITRPGPGAAAERAAGVRKLYLYTVLFLGALLTTLAVRDVLRDLLDLIAGRARLADLLSGEILPPLAFALVRGGFWTYHARVAAGDRAAVPETGGGATLRRWFVYGLSFIGLMTLLFAAQGLIETLWERMIVSPRSSGVAPTGLTEDLADRLTWALAGLMLWVPAWTWSLRWIVRADEPDPERNSTLRKVYVYSVLAVAVALTVWTLGGSLHEVLRTALVPGEGRWTSLLDKLGSSISVLLVFGLTWLYHANVVKREAVLAGEPRQQATVRWTYGYLVAFVGAITLAVGIAAVVQTMLELVFQLDRGPLWLQEQLSLQATLIPVGLAVWTIPWRRLQRETATVTELPARGGLPRRVYLYLAFGVSVLTLLGTAAFVVYQLLRLVLGERWTSSTTSDLINSASLAIVAILFLVYHLRVFREDAASAAATAATGPGFALALIRAPTLDRLGRVEQALRNRARDGLEVQLVRVDQPTAERILDQARSDNADSS